MSATLTAFARKLPRQSRTPTLEPLRVRIFVWSVIIPTVSLLTTLTILQWPSVIKSLPNLVVWLAVVSAAELLPIPYTSHVRMTLSMPLLLAAGMLFSPLDAGLMGFIGSWDLRWFRREISTAREVFNRSQVALSALTASLVFHGLGADVRNWPVVAFACLAALLADMVVNVALVSGAAVLMTGERVTQVMAGVVLDSPWSFLLTYISLAPVAFLIALAASEHRLWGLLVAIAPLFLARQVFTLLKRSSQSKAEAFEKERLVREISQRIAEERHDERARLAMDLHDDALAALYQVHLMGEVLRQDLSFGRLFELEADMPKLKAATVRATEALRTLIRNLRQSPVGAFGLTRTLELLIEDAAGRTNARIETDIRDVGASASIQLLIYQVGREALENAIRHSQAERIHVSLFRDADVSRLIVRDDGKGFVLSLADSDMHFGLRIMAERVHLAGGILHIETEVGRGTQVTARFPLVECSDEAR